MDSAELRAMQAPIKERYKTDPQAAVITLKAKGTIDSESLSCKVETGRALAVAGLHPATGGSGLELCSGDMLLEALVACAAVTLQAVSTAFGVTLTKSVIRAEGDLDFRGTLGVAKDAPVGFRDIRIVFDIAGDAPPETLQKIVSTSERYCVVLQTLNQRPNITVESTI